MTEGDELIATASQTVGPFFHLGLAPEATRHLADRPQGGDPITLIVRVTDGDGEAVGDAAVEIAQNSVFARMPTGEDGRCTFEAVHATSDQSKSSTSYIHVCLFARGLLRHLHTRIYLAGDPAIDRDPVFALVPEHRRSTLLAQRDPERPGVWLFEVRLQGDGETVFFDE